MPGPGNRMRNPRPFGRNMNSNQGSGGQNFGSDGVMASSGPLMSNHLQLHELDLELALLKRKREMIETQHNMLVTENRFGGSNQYGFNQAPQSFGQRSEPTRNFSSFYNDGPGQQADRFATPQGMKRRAIDPWDNSSPPKRFNASSGPKRTPGRYEPRSTQPPPLMGPSFRQRRPTPASIRTNFKPTKVTKPKPNAAPNKLNSVPVAERKNLVDKASNLVQKSRDSYLFEADKPTNLKLLGRLELALGSIVREMREAHGKAEPHAVTFTNVASQRALKQALRERIRALMLGKVVGTGPEVVALYRKEYPKETDLALLDKARENIVMKGNLAIELIKRDNPERFFRHNFKRLLDVSLNAMFERMEKLYKDADTGKPLQEIIDSMLAEADKTLQEAEAEVKEEIKENDESQSADNTATEAKENGEATNENVATGETAVKLEENEARPADDSAKPEEGGANPEDGDAKPEEGSEKPEDSAAKPKNETADDENKEKPKEAAPKSQRFQQRSTEEHVKARFYTRLMDTLMKRNLPLVLPRYKEFILKILGTEAAFKETKAYLIKTTDEKVDEKANGSTATPTKSDGTQMKRYQLFVKVMGRPGLPKKGMMKSFLDNFHPTLVKKHRNMHNVLFIAFDNKENFDNILAKNGETIGNCKLEIKVSERINKNKQNSNEGATTGEGEAPANGDVEMDGNKTNDSINLNDTLDDQINDLLSSIREEEEEQKDAPENEGSQQETEANADDQADETANNENNQDTEESNKTEPEVVQKEVEAVKTEAQAKGTPTKAAAKQTSTPSAIRTRRSSRLPQN
ncbi:hypothetical protein O0L34_g18773 [Tuta absoluta]|nr:hypothetical protein O0L34_g18773 [Tuta absoluta]